MKYQFPSMSDLMVDRLMGVYMPSDVRNFFLPYLGVLAGKEREVSDVFRVLCFAHAKFVRVAGASREGVLNGLIRQLIEAMIPDNERFCADVLSAWNTRN